MFHFYELKYCMENCLDPGSTLFTREFISRFMLRGQKYLNIALVLQDELLTIFTHPANTCTCPLKAYAVKNIRE